MSTFQANLSVCDKALIDALTLQARPSWTDMAAAAHPRCKPEQPAGGRPTLTPGSSGQGTEREQAGPVSHLPRCCWTAGEDDSAVGAGGVW